MNPTTPTSPLRYAFRFALAALLLVPALAGCDAADDAADPTVFPSDLVGLWSFDEDPGEYFEITSEGRIGDFFSRYSGPFACFEGFDDDDDIRIEPLGDDRFAIIEREFDGTDDRVEVTITVEGNRMTIAGEDEGETFTETYTRWTQDVNACAFNLQGEYELESVNGEAFPYTYTAPGSTGQTHQFEVRDGEASWYDTRSDVRVTVFQTYPNGSSAGGYGMRGTTSITSSAGAFEILPDEDTNPNYPDASATGVPTATGVRVMLRHPELGPEPLELAYRRVEGDDFAASRRLTPVR